MIKMMKKRKSLAKGKLQVILEHSLETLQLTTFCH